MADVIAELVADVTRLHVDNSYGACISCTELDSDRDFAAAFPCPPARLAAALSVESVAARLRQAMYARLPYSNWTLDAEGNAYRLAVAFLTEHKEPPAGPVEEVTGEAGGTASVEEADG